jgi:hypothetical protein
MSDETQIEFKTRPRLRGLDAKGLGHLGLVHLGLVHYSIKEGVGSFSAQRSGSGNLPIIEEEFIEYTSNQRRKTKSCQHVTGWNWKR